MPEPTRAGDDLPRRLAAAAEPLPVPGEPGFADWADRLAGARVVALGEASHGTAEFYRARAALTRHLVERHGATAVAFEADWPDMAALDRHVRHLPAREGAPPPFRRFPEWMWRNREMAAFVAWLRGWNADLPPERRVSLHGLDIYNMHDSIAAVIGYLDATDPDAASVARDRYGCLDPWRQRPESYGRAVLTSRYEGCEAKAVAQARELLARRLAEDGEGLFDAAQNARLVASAERYYRVMYHGGPESWNLRDTHMADTLAQVLEAKGRGSKVVAWAHNSHVGDARATGMGTEQGELSLGQLCRERWGDAVRLVGFGTHAGTVSAASGWNGERETMRVRPSRPGSVEAACHATGLPRFLLDLRAAEGSLRAALEEPRPERFIGVIYRPGTELLSHYAQAALARQFDAWVWLDETSAVEPIPGPPEEGRVPDTFPFGL